MTKAKKSKKKLQSSRIVARWKAKTQWGTVTIRKHSDGQYTQRSLDHHFGGSMAIYGPFPSLKAAKGFTKTYDNVGRQATWKKTKKRKR